MDERPTAPAERAVRILLAEDDERLARLVMRCLARPGWTVEWAPCGRDAVERAADGSFSLLVLDFNLPDMTAVQIVEHLRERGRRVEFIVATGEGDERIAVHMMKLGARDYLLKDRLLLERLPVVISRVLREIDSERRAALLESRFRAAFEGSSDALLLLEHGRIVDGNSAALGLYGREDRRDLLGRHLGELAPPAQPGGRESMVLAEEWVGEALARRSVRFDWILARPDQAVIPTEVLLSAFEFDGRTVVQAAIRDVRRRRAAEEALRLSEERFRLLFQSSVTGIALHEIVCDAAGAPVDYRFLAVNPAFEAMTGIQAAAVVGRTVRELMPDTEASWIERYGRVALTGRPDHFESYSGVLGKHFEVSAYSPHPGQFAAIFVDVTERRRAVEALVRSEAELSAIYEHSPVVLCVVDEEARIVRANRAAAALRGMEPRELVGLPVGLLLGCVPPDGACAGTGVPEPCAACSMRGHLLDAIRNGSSHRRIEIRVPCREPGRTGEIRWLCSYARITPGGRALALLTAEDVSELRRTEMQARQQAALLDVASDAILLRDLSDTVLFWNRGAERLYGLTREQALGRKLTDVTTPSSSPDLLAGAARAVEELGEWTGEINQVDRSGRRLVVQSRWTLVRDEAGRPQSVLVVNTDVTERARLTEQLLRAQRLESVGTLTSGIAHDLNNVLSPIVMSLGVIRSLVHDANALSLLETMEHCALRGAGIVRQLLTFARGADGAHVEIEPRILLQDIARIVRETFPRSIRVEVDFAHGLKPVTGDHVQLQQVMMNLCINARDAMPEGGTLVLRADAGTPVQGMHGLPVKGTDAEYVVITVADTGTGIPPEHIDRIFDPFFTTKPAGSGTGLGLAMAHGIVQKHGGFIEVDSTVGRGSTFRVFLPVAAGARPAPEGEGTSSDVTSGNGESVLVVDDEATVRHAIATALRRAGYLPVTAHDGTEAMMLLENPSSSIRVVITDLMMAGVDGLDLIRKLRSNGHCPPIIAMSGLGEERRLTAALEAGAAVVVSKPFTAVTLLTQVQRVIGRRELEAVAGVQEAEAAGLWET